MPDFKIPTAPLNTVYATLDRKFYDTIEFASGITLFKDTGFHPEESAMLEGTVVSVPKALMKRPDYAGMAIDIKPGDRILMRYDVVYSYTHQPERDTPVYKNVLLHEGVEYWKVDIQKVFAVILAEGMRMLNGYVFCETVPEERGDYGLLIRPEHFRTEERRDKLRIKYIGEPLIGQPTLFLLPGDIVYTAPGMAQSYEINVQKFLIIKQSHIIAKERNLSDLANS